MAGPVARLSRLWAEALQRGCDAERLRAIYPQLRDGPALRRALATLAQRADTYTHADMMWRAALFAAGPASPAQAEAMRARAARDYWLARLAFMRVPGWRRTPAVRWRVATPAEVQATRGHRLAAADPFPLPLADVEMSRAIEHGGLRYSWWRFPAGDDDVAWASVVEPTGPVRATVVSLHGLGVEADFLGPDRDFYRPLVRQGVRLVYPEAPWHGRRRRSGWAGGEPVVGRGPLGLIDLLAQAAPEIGLWTAHARSLGPGRVGVGGISLGALTAQVAAGAAATWPAEARPDALLLITTTGDIGALLEQGSLTARFGAPAQIHAAGWTMAELEPWRPLLEPPAAAPLDPARILAVLATADTVTPYAGGDELVRHWDLPTQNVVRRWRGHFSQAAAMTYENGVRARWLALLEGKR